MIRFKKVAYIKDIAKRSIYHEKIRQIKGQQRNCLIEGNYDE